MQVNLNTHKKEWNSGKNYKKMSSQPTNEFAKLINTKRTHLWFFIQAVMLGSMRFPFEFRFEVLHSVVKIFPFNGTGRLSGV